MPTVEECRERAQKIDSYDREAEQRQERTTVLCQGLTYGDLYSLLYGNSMDGQFLVQCREVRRPPLNFLNTVKPRALLLLGPTLYQICFNEGEQGEERQQQRKSTQLRNGYVLRTRSIMRLRRIEWNESIRQKICWDVRSGSHRFVTHEMDQTPKAKHLLDFRLMALLDRLEADAQNTEIVRSLRRESSIEDLLTRLLLLSVIGSDEGWNWANPPQSAGRTNPVLMAPLTYQGITYSWSEEFPQPPLVRLWNKRSGHAAFQLIGKNKTIIGGVGKTTALESLQQAGLAGETVWLVPLREAYREVKKESGRLDLDRENHPLLAYIRKKYGTDITGWGRLSDRTFLLDGFNELTRLGQRQFCRDVVALSQKGASVIISSRTDVRLGLV